MPLVMQVVYREEKTDDQLYILAIQTVHQSLKKRDVLYVGDAN